MRRIVFRIMGTLLAIGSVGVLGATLFGASQLAVYGGDMMQRDGSGMLGIAAALLVGGGVLLAVLFALLAFMSYRLRAAKGLIVGAIIIALLGLGSIVSGAGIIAARIQQDQQTVEEDSTTTPVTLPDRFSRVTKIIVETKGMTISYRATGQSPAAEFTALPGTTQPTIEINGTTATITAAATSSGYFNYMPELTLSGQRLNDIVVTQGKVTYTTDAQPNLHVRADNQSVVEITGTYDAVTLERAAQAWIKHDGATVRTLTE